jgi:V8-like Glu-specific endopeptidase
MIYLTAIVKLFLLYEGQGKAAKKNEKSWAMGTGWLIAPDIIVTAGHCSYDWSHKYGKLAAVKAYIGYNGKSSIPDASVQFRQGKRIAAPAEWLKGPSRAYDVSFIMVDSPFKGIKPFKFDDTPAQGNLNIGVVGYPGDKDNGEYMFEHYLDTEFDLAKSQRMLSYLIDTYGGKFAAPFLEITLQISNDSVPIRKLWFSSSPFSGLSSYWCPLLWRRYQPSFGHRTSWKRLL